MKNISYDICKITGHKFPEYDLTQLIYLRKELADLIRKDYPALKDDDKISGQALNKYRKLYIEQLMAEQVGELNDLEREVLSSMQKEIMLARDVDEEMEENLTVGQRLADKIATFGGSWGFIIIFFAFIVLWMLINIFLLFNKGFDPYPFILLNLILSCLAAVQAPVIMMSQNRQEAKDRARSRHDYQVNLKAELEIQQLHEKIDYMMRKQEQRLFEIQRLQTEMLEQILERLNKNKLS